MQWFGIFHSDHIWICPFCIVWWCSFHEMQDLNVLGCLSWIQLSPLSLNCCRMKSLSLFLKRWNLFNIWSRFVTDLWFVASFILCGLVSGTGMGTYKTRKTNSHLSCSEERNEVDCLNMFVEFACSQLERCGMIQGDYFRKASKSLDFRERPHSETNQIKMWVTQPKPRSWLALVNEYADCAFSSIFQAIGDRHGRFTSCQMKLTVNSKVPMGSNAQ